MPRMTVQPTIKRGFDLPVPPVVSYGNEDTLRSALRAQKEAYAQLDAGVITDIDVEGHIAVRGAHRDLRLSGAAFADLCRLTRLPQPYLMRLSASNEALALDLVRDALRRELPTIGDTVVLVDTEARRIDGVMPRERYNPYSSFDAYRATRSALEDSYTLAGGWISGPTARIRFVDEHRPEEVRVGDVVHTGVSLINNFASDGATRIAEFNQRLRCLNGMLVTTDDMAAIVKHTGDVPFEVSQALVQAASRSRDVIPLLRESEQRRLKGDDVRAVRRYLADPKRHGSPALDTAATRGASREATDAGRDPGDLRLWDFVNGVTEVAKNTADHNRRSELESTAYRLLTHVLRPSDN